MKSIILAAFLLASSQQVIVFVDGTRMDIQSYEVKGSLVTLTTAEGKLQSVPLAYVDMPATERANGGGAAGGSARPPAPTPSQPAPAPPMMPTESIAPEPTVPEPEPPPATPPVSRPAPPPRDVRPPPVWSNEELQVSLVVPSSDWMLPQMPPSFDVAVALDNGPANARATLALIRQKLRSRGDFESVLTDIRSSISRSPGFRSLNDGALDLEPYTAHEFRFLKTVDGVEVFNRLTVVYSRDLAYVLSLTCPNDKATALQADFNAFVRGLVVKKSRRDLSF